MNTHQAPGELPTPAKSCATSQVVKDYISASVELGRSPSTIRLREMCLPPFAQAVPNLPCRRFHIRDYMKTVQGADNTRWTHFKEIRAFINWFHIEEELPPLNMLRLAPPQPEPKNYTLSNAEFALVLDKARNFYDRTLLLTLRLVGYRTGELVSLDHQNVFDDELLVQGKEGEKVYNIPPWLAQDLKRLGSKDVFYNKLGKRIDRHGVYQRIRRMIDDAGIVKPHMGGHLLRHTFASRELDATGDMTYVQKALGHKSTRATERYAKRSDTSIKKIYQERHGQLNMFDQA